jgi:hypothetical protein
MIDNIKIAGEDDNIRIGGVSRTTTNNNDANTSELVEFSKCETSKTLVEFMKNHIQAKKPKENDDNSIKNGLQNKFVLAKNAKIKEITNSKKIKRKKTTKKIKVMN